MSLVDDTNRLQAAFTSSGRSTAGASGSVNDVQALVVSALNKQIEYWARLDQAQGNRFSGWTSKPLELLGGHKAVRAPVHGLSSGITTFALFGVYLYTPYSLVKSTIALMFSGGTSSKNAPLAII